jgi:uncharacterized protein YggE
MKNLKIAIGIGVVLLLFVVTYSFLGDKATVSAQGFSSIKVEPDLISVYLSIETRDIDSLKDAQDTHKSSVGLLYSELFLLGLSEKDIETSYYNVGPEYEWTQNNQRLKGYLASQQFVVRLKDFDKVVSVVDSAVKSETLISGINFELSPEKQNDYKSSALEQASKDARKKAESTASGLDKKIGKLVSVESSDFNYVPVVYYAKAEDTSGSDVRDTALQINPSDIDVSASVTVVYVLR